MGSHKSSISGLASVLNYGEKRLVDIVDNASRYYAPFHITTEKNGKVKVRHIDNPHKRYPLRALQKQIGKVLLQPEISHLDTALVGGIKKRNIMQHILPHVGKKTVVCMDLANCFPSITYGQVVKVFRYLGYSAELARLLASATTFRGYLPQGAPTSSLLCNFVMNPMAKRIKKTMDDKGISYTQYIDDIVFSGDDDVVVRAMINKVYTISTQHKQRIKREKTEILDSKQQQRIMHITVNEKTKASLEVVSETKRAIDELPEDGVITMQAKLSVVGRIISIEKVDKKAASHLRKLFDSKVTSVYEDGSNRMKDGTIGPCDFYKKGKSGRTKCPCLVS